MLRWKLAVKFTNIVESNYKEYFVSSASVGKARPAVASIVPCINYRVINKIRCITQTLMPAGGGNAYTWHQILEKIQGSSKIWCVLMSIWYLVTE